MPPRQPRPPTTAQADSPDRPVQLPRPLPPALPMTSRLPLTPRDPEHVIAHELARSLHTLMQFPLLEPDFESPATLERAWLAAHAWSVLVRPPGRPGGMPALRRTPTLSVILLRQLAIRHTACSLEDLRRQVHARAVVHANAPAAERTLMHLLCALDTSATALLLALRLAGRPQGFGTGRPSRYRAQRPVAPRSSPPIDR